MKGVCFPRKFFIKDWLSYNLSKPNPCCTTSKLKRKCYKIPLELLTYSTLVFELFSIIRVLDWLNFGRPCLTLYLPLLALYLQLSIYLFVLTAFSEPRRAHHGGPPNWRLAHYYHPVIPPSFAILSIMLPAPFVRPLNWTKLRQNTVKTRTCCLIGNHLGGPAILINCYLVFWSFFPSNLSWIYSINSMSGTCPLDALQPSLIRYCGNCHSDDSSMLQKDVVWLCWQGGWWFRRSTTEPKKLLHFFSHLHCLSLGSFNFHYCSLSLSCFMERQYFFTIVYGAVTSVTFN